MRGYRGEVSRSVFYRLQHVRRQRVKILGHLDLSAQGTGFANGDVRRWRTDLCNDLVVRGKDKPMSILDLFQEGGQISAKLPNADAAGRGCVGSLFGHGSAPFPKK